MIRKWNFLLIAAVVAAPMALSAATDNAAAAVYDDGVAAGDNGGSGFGAWAITITDFGGPAPQVIAADPTSVGGSALLATSGEAFVVVTTPVDAVNLSRPFAALPDGALISWTMQRGNEGVADVNSITSEVAKSGGQYLARVQSLSASTNWTVQDAGTNADTGITSTTPVRVDIVKTNTTTYAITVTDLTGVASPFNLPARTFANSGGEPEAIAFSTASLSIATNANFLFNSLSATVSSVDEWTVLSE